MTVADRWLLPDGVEEILPEDARCIEELRRQLLDLFHVWGYELVIPPLVEYTESLLIGLGSDVDLHSFKVIDQLSGRLMAVRPDITPQVARIDAHSLGRDGIVRLCYAGSVLHTRARSLLASRTPIQLGAELYGEPGIAADVEVVCLMLETLGAAGVDAICLDLGHVGIYRSLIAAAGLDAAAEAALFDALQRKSHTEIRALCKRHVADTSLAQMIIALASLHGDAAVLTGARSQLAEGPAAIAEALDQLEYVAAAIAHRTDGVQCYFDLGELRGYHYHTGLVFAAYSPGHGQAIANGGRYDHIGEVFGRARPATGFTTELKTLARLSRNGHLAASRIFAPHSDDRDLLDAIVRLRADGEVVVCGMPGESPPADCDRQLVQLDDRWSLAPIR